MIKANPTNIVRGDYHAIFTSLTHESFPLINILIKPMVHDSSASLYTALHGYDQDIFKRN